MRRRSRLHVALALLAITLLLSQDGLSYGVITHAAISFTAYQAGLPTIQQNFFGALQIDPQQTFGPQTVAQAAGTGLGPLTAQGWIIDGSQAEDNGPLPTIVTQLGGFRSLFHFFDPFNDRGLSNGPTAPCGLPIPTLSSASDWGVFGVGSLGAYNDFPYASKDPTRDARIHFFNGISGSDPAVRSQELALMFRSLGQVMHLIQDMAQPQHVRNDAHLDLSDSAAAFLGCQAPSAYERYVDTHPQWQSLPGTGAKVTFELPQFFFANGSGSGLAQFTNSNFVSAGTNCTNTVTCNAVGNYPAPSMSGGPTNNLYWQLANYPDLNACQNASILGNFPLALCGSVVTFFSNPIVDQYSGATSQNSRMTTYSLFDLDLLKNNLQLTFTLNHFNYDQQARMLIPKAVDYSAGLLTHFFRESMTAQGDPSGFTITNTTMNGATPETMDGTFALYYDDQNGNRYAVPGASWSLSIPGGATSYSLIFTAPTNPSPAHPGQYTLVFQGTVGGEDGAVAGAVVQLTGLTVGGTVSGLTGSGLVLQDNGGNNLALSANGPFTFPTALASGAAYNVTVFAQPTNPSETCTVTSGSGTIGSSNVTNVSVVCTPAGTPPGTTAGTYRITSYSPFCLFGSCPAIVPSIEGTISVNQAGYLTNVSIQFGSETFSGSSNDFGNFFSFFLLFSPDAAQLLLYDPECSRVGMPCIAPFTGPTIAEFLIPQYFIQLFYTLTRQ